MARELYIQHIVSVISRSENLLTKYGLNYRLLMHQQTNGLQSMTSSAHILWCFIGFFKDPRDSLPIFFYNESFLQSNFCNLARYIMDHGSIVLHECRICNRSWLCAY